MWYMIMDLVIARLQFFPRENDGFAALRKQIIHGGPTD